MKRSNIKVMTVREMMARAMAMMDSKGNGNSYNSRQGIKQVKSTTHQCKQVATGSWHSSIGVGLQLWWHSKWVNGCEQSTAGSSSSISGFGSNAASA